MPKECSNYRTIALISHASKVMLKILQVRLQQYVNHELPGVQVGFRKGRGTREQIANICQLDHQKSKRIPEKTSTFTSLTMLKTFDCVYHNKPENSSKNGNSRPPYLPPEKSVCRSRSNS